MEDVRCFKNNRRVVSFLSTMSNSTRITYACVATDCSSHALFLLYRSVGRSPVDSPPLSISQSNVISVETVHEREEFLYNSH